MNDLSIILQCIAVSLPKAYFHKLAPLGGVLRALTGVAGSVKLIVGGSSKAALTMHFAAQNNIADLHAKESSQETLIVKKIISYQREFSVLFLGFGSRAFFRKNATKIITNVFQMNYVICGYIQSF